jgi:hypothetical protein
MTCQRTSKYLCTSILAPTQEHTGVHTNVQACERIISFPDDPPISVISNPFPVGINLTFPPSRLQPPRRPEACDRGPVHIGHRACVSAMAAVWRHRPTAPLASGDRDRWRRSETPRNCRNLDRGRSPRHQGKPKDHDACAEIPRHSIDRAKGWP